MAFKPSQHEPRYATRWWEREIQGAQGEGLVWEYPLARLPAREALTFLAIMWHGNSEGKAWPSIERIAVLTGAKPRTVKRVIAALSRKGYLKVKRGGGRRHTNQYGFLLPDAKGVRVDTVSPRDIRSPEPGHPRSGTMTTAAENGDIRGLKRCPQSHPNSAELSSDSASEQSVHAAVKPAREESHSETPRETGAALSSRSAQQRGSWGSGWDSPKVPAQFSRPVDLLNAWEDLLGLESRARDTKQVKRDEEALEALAHRVLRGDFGLPQAAAAYLTRIAQQIGKRKPPASSPIGMFRAEASKAMLRHMRGRGQAQTGEATPRGVG